MSLQADRDEAIRLYHTRAGGGLYCPLCRSWTPLHFDSPQGVRFACESCGTVVIMPRVQLARAISRKTAKRK